MAEIQLLGLLHEATPTADALEGLRKLGIPDEKITVMSMIPYRAEMLGRPRTRRRVGLIALIGAVLGLIGGLGLTVGIFLLYPLYQGGQPLVPIPPTIVILFETTMMGTMWAAFFGLLGENRFPVFKDEVYDPRITEGHIGVLAVVDEELADQAQKILEENGAHHLRREENLEHTDTRLTVFWASAAGLVTLAVIVTLMIAYDVTKIHFPTQMENQLSTAYEQGPRRAAPAAAVPIQGPVLVAGQPASLPVPASPDSLQRGQALFDLTCAICHGAGGTGNGTVGAFFNPKPADLTSGAVQGMSDDDLFLVITQGRGVMPNMAENLSPEERWDVINYVRSLKK